LGNQGGVVMKFRTLKSDEQLLEYSKKVAPLIDVELPLEYLKRSKVVACYDRANNICGGFVIVKQGPFRVLDSIPTPCSRTLSYQNSSKVAEVTGLWLSHSLIKNNCAFGFWCRLLWSVATSGKKYFAYAYSLRKPKIGRMYSKARPEVLFKGPTKVLPGMPSADEESVEVIRLRNLIISPFLSPGFFLKRFQGVRIVNASA